MTHETQIMTVPTTLDRCAAAIAEVVSGYRGPFGDIHPVFQAKYREAARACVAALLPVSEALDDVMLRCDKKHQEENGNEWAPPSHMFTAAIAAILEGKA